MDTTSFVAKPATACHALRSFGGRMLSMRGYLISLLRYGIGVVSATTAFCLNQAFPENDAGPVLAFLCAVAVGCWHGPGPGLLATVLSAVLLAIFHANVRTGTVIVFTCVA